MSVLLSLLIAAWRLALHLNKPVALPRGTAQPAGTPSSPTVKIVQGQLTAEVPERKERWMLRFAVSRYDPKRQVATTQQSLCQVTRNGQLVAIFAAPTAFVRFREHVMEMGGGVTVIAVLPRLKVWLPSLRWHWQDGQLIGTGKVKLEGERVSSIADGLEGDTTLQQLSLKGNVQLQWSEKGDGR